MTAPPTVSNALEHDVIPVNVSFKLIRRCFRFTQYNKEKANVVRLAQRVVDGDYPGHEQLVDDDQVAIKPAKHLAGPGDGALKNK